MQAVNFVGTLMTKINAPYKSNYKSSGVEKGGEVSCMNKDNPLMLSKITHSQLNTQKIGNIFFHTGGIHFVFIFSER